MIYPINTALRHKDGLTYQVVAANPIEATLNHEDGKTCISRRLTWKEIDRDFHGPTESSLDEYTRFLESKQVTFQPKGFEVPLEDLNPPLFGEKHQFQPRIIQWALKLGCAAIFAQYGLGKTIIQVKWAEQVAKHTLGKVLLLAPLAVAPQTVKEADRFGVTIAYCRNQAEADESGEKLIVTNYEMLKHFDPSQYVGIVLDESSVLKQYRGKTKELLCNSFKDTPYRLCCSATPAPNDWLELGNHAEFLGVATSHLMISRWFQNDTMQAGAYKLRPHAASDFWQWVASWAVCLTMPSDLGFSDDGWKLPPLNIHSHVIPVDHTETWGEANRDGQLQLVRTPSLSATNTHKEARLNCDRIADKIADLVQAEALEAWVLWCFTNYESDALKSALPEAIELRGDEKSSVKQEKLAAFTNGEIKKLITKPEIAGLGLNWQHCQHQAFMMGTSYSFELFHQALHRLYRFGQKRPVETHLVFPETAGGVRQVISRKQRQFEAMQLALRNAVRLSQLAAHQQQVHDDYIPQVQMILPDWLRSKSA